MTRTEEIAAEALGLLQEMVEMDVWRALWSHHAYYGTDRTAQTDAVEGLQRRAEAFMQGRVVESPEEIECKTVVVWPDGETEVVE